MSFTANVLHIVHTIPSGETLSYRDVAARAGNPRAARAVGNIMKKNYDPKVPCHRVIKSDGSPGEYNGGAEVKREKLVSEGVCLT